MNSEAERLFSVIQSLDDRITNLQGEPADGRRAKRPGMIDEAEWVRLAIRKQAPVDPAAPSCIEKTLAGLIWAARSSSSGHLLLTHLKAHGRQQ